MEQSRARNAKRLQVGGVYRVARTLKLSICGVFLASCATSDVVGSRESNDSAKVYESCHPNEEWYLMEYSEEPCAWTSLLVDARTQTIAVVRDTEPKCPREPYLAQREQGEVGASSIEKLRSTHQKSRLSLDSIRRDVLFLDGVQVTCTVCKDGVLDTSASLPAFGIDYSQAELEWLKVCIAVREVAAPLLLPIIPDDSGREGADELTP